MTSSTRPPFVIFIGVQRALILREAVTRLSTERASWLWMLLEPTGHIVFLMVVHGVLQHHMISGADTPLFIGLGVLGFFMMRNVALRGMDAISSNGALFAYRQVRAVDTIFARAVLEALLSAVVGTLLLTGCLFAGGVDVAPHNVLKSTAALATLWLLGLGLGLTLSVVATLASELGRMAKTVFTPLYFFSAVMYPVAWIPRPLRHILMLNPVVHGLETLRAGFFPRYHTDDLVNLSYPALVALTLCALGLALHVRFTDRLVAR